MTQEQNLNDPTSDVVESFYPTPQTETERRILKLFKELPVDRQSVVLDELHDILEDDDGDEDDDDDEDLPHTWGAAPVELGDLDQWND